MNNLAIIGIGNVSGKYLEGLRNSKYNLVCIIDKNCNAVGRKYYQNYPFYTSLTEALKKETINYLLISTPPNTHHNLIIEAFNNNINVFVEKPLTLDLESFNKLNKLAEEKSLKLYTLLHWKYGNEVINLDSHLNNNKKIKSIKTIIYDPYATKEGILKEEYLNLGGAIVDSLINVLSFYETFLDISFLKFAKREVLKDKEVIIKACLSYQLNNIDLHIHIDWTKERNYKKTTITYDDDTKLLINHSVPYIKYLDNKVVYKTKNRLKTHYFNLFNNFKEDKNNLKQIHKLLFEQLKKE